MRRGIIVLGLSVAALAVSSCVPAPPPTVYVHAEPGGPPHPFAGFVGLDEYGHWFVYGGYGWVWAPSVVAADWRPYMVGRWVWTDEGWMWLSAEPWGWATYHYGRWIYDGAYGWIWIPDTQWGASWVCWREGGGFIGWSPMPPGVIVGPGMVCSDWDGSWMFVGIDAFLQPDIHHYVVPPSRNHWVVTHTRVDVSTSTHHESGPDPARIPGGQGLAPRHIDVGAAEPSPRIDVDENAVRVVPPAIDGRVSPTRVKPAPGAVRLNEPPSAGQHRPETDGNPPEVRPLPPSDRGPKAPAPPPQPKPKAQPQKKDDRTPPKKVK